ncbi:OmpA family protein [Allomuricauda sp. R78024]|uniref:OmpA family protein n=1 Tax=Allomuricauda sp. R78024 TaxID=3093867 RepID=UPI0037C523DB
MTKKTTYLLGILTVVIIGTFLYMNLCSECRVAGNQEEAISLKSKTTSPTYPYLVSDDDYSYEAKENFNFNISNPSFLMPISGELKDGIASLKDYLNSNEQKTVNLTGFYSSNEENHTSFSNLGLARANSVKNHLMLNGIPSSQINTLGELKEDMIFHEGILLGPITYHVSKQEEEPSTIN